MLFDTSRIPVYHLVSCENGYIVWYVVVNIGVSFGKS